MSGTTRSPVKKAVAKRTESSGPVPEPEELSPEVQALLADEQNKLNSATMEAQMSYLSQRVAELTKENYELRKAAE